MVCQSDAARTSLRAKVGGHPFAGREPRGHDGDSSPQVLHRLEREVCTVELGVDIRGQADVHLRKVLRDDLGWNRSDVVDTDYYVVNAIRASAPHPWGSGAWDRDRGGQ